LRPTARERLAKVAGILLAYPDLRLEVDGHTDSVGSEAYNQQLSEKRAASVRDYLAQQSIPISSVVVRGFGKTQPVASNATAAGRQQNRRVELVVSGEVFGAKIGGDSNAISSRNLKQAHACSARYSAIRDGSMRHHLPVQLADSVLLLCK
jgi:OmpA family